MWAIAKAGYAVGRSRERVRPRRAHGGPVGVVAFGCGAVGGSVVAFVLARKNRRARQHGESDQAPSTLTT